MRRAAAILALLLTFSACGDGGEVPAEYLMVEVTAPQTVTAGQGFPLTVRRVWSKDLVPKDVEEDVLPPLRLVPEKTVRRESDTHVEEVRSYLAYAFSVGPIEVHPPTLTATPVLGGAGLSVAGNRLSLSVVGTVDPAAPGAAELPGGPLLPSRTWRPVLVLAVGALVGVYLGRRRKQQVVVAPEPPPETAPPSLEERTLSALAQLRASRPSGRIETAALYLQVTTLLRRYLGERFSFRTRFRTTEELIGDAPLRPHASRLQEAFRPADLVKFARHDPSDAERERLFEAAAALVRETGAP